MRYFVIALYLTALLLPGGCSVAFSQMWWDWGPVGFEDLFWFALNIGGYLSAIFFGLRLLVVGMNRGDISQETGGHITLAAIAIVSSIVFIAWLNSLGL